MITRISDIQITKGYFNDDSTSRCPVSVMFQLRMVKMIKRIKNDFIYFVFGLAKLKKDVY